jgi:glycosyltransferase involved in cell wall biosynthesis
MQNLVLTRTPANDPITAGIIRDHKYWQTLKNDMRRQQWRRRVHRLHALWQQRTQWPLWQKLTTRPGRLSICIMTMNAEQRLGPVLARIRPFADELVIGVDSKTTDGTLAIAQAYADTCITIDNPAATCNGGLKTLVSHCTGDWLLRLDDDELMPPEFWELLPALMAQTRYTHFKLPRLHLNQLSPLLWIDDGYLYPDYQLRLLKNDPALHHFPPPVGHVGLTCEGERGRLASLPIIHLNLAINSPDARAAKLRKYIDRLAGQWVHPVNETCLLYERFDYRVRPYLHPNAQWLDSLTQLKQALGL